MIRPDVRIVTDLDRMVSDPVGFRWNGKVHIIKPMSNEVFLGVFNELARMDAINQEIIKGATIDRDGITLAYASLFGIVCDTIKLKDVRQMTNAQMTGLFKEIMECVTGKAHAEVSQKKTQPGEAVGA